MTDTIRPPHAISLWANKDILYVELPQANGSGEQSHTIRLPLNVYGLTQAVELLRSREVTSRIGTKGDPTQHQAEASIKDMQKKAAGYTGPITRPKQKLALTPERAMSVRSILRQIGIGR